MRGAIHALKFDRLHPTARQLGRMLAKAIAQLESDAPAEMLVVPIPLHKSKLNQRGFKQSRALAEHALKFLHKTCPNWQLTLASRTLMRLRATGSQAGLTLHQRGLNVRGAFSVSDPGMVDSKHILLIDDVLTTGATARAAARSLIRAGAASVWVATLARARRITYFRRDALTEDAEERDRMHGNEPAEREEQAERNSSQDQPSF
jgi:ComF family protein